MANMMIMSAKQLSASLVLGHACDWACASIRSNESYEPKQMFDHTWDPLT